MRTITGATAWQGDVYTVGTNGADYPISGGEEGGADHKGWAYKDVDGASGVGAGWESVLDAFLTNGTCTIGWEIWVDGDLVCRSDGTHV